MPGGKNQITGKDGKIFVKGDPRINKLGRPKKMNLERYLRKVLLEKVNDVPAIKAILTKLRDLAIAGDTRAAEMLLDRAFGKAKQTIEPTGPFMIMGIQYIVPGNGSTNQNIIPADENCNQTDTEATRSLGSPEDTH